jgi:excisionase family DNA binding protein
MMKTRPHRQTVAPPAARAADPLYERPQAAAYLGVTPGTLEVWASTGRYNLSYVKVGRCVKYRQSALDAWLIRRTRGGHADAPEAA